MSHHEKHERRSERLFRGLIGSRGSSVENEVDETSPVATLSLPCEAEDKSPESSRLGFRNRVSKKWRLSRNLADRTQSMEAIDPKDKDKDKHAALPSLSGGLIGVRSADGEDESLVFSNTGRLLSGSVGDLLKHVQRLVSGSEEAMVFAFTHTLFMTETELLETLLGSLLSRQTDHSASAEKLRARRVTNFLKTWIGTNNRWQKAELLDIVNRYMEQYAAVPELANDSRILKDFIAQQEQAPESLAMLQTRARERLATSDYRSSPSSSSSSSSSSPLGKPKSILDFDVNTLAAQLTCLEQTFFQLVDVEQLLAAAPGRLLAVPSLQPWTEHALQLGLWVRCELRNSGPLRTRLLDRLVHLAGALRELGNFGTAFQIVLAIKSLSYAARSKDLLDTATHKLFVELSSWTSSAKHYHAYRETLDKRVVRPKLPYLHVTLSDIDRASRMPTFSESSSSSSPSSSSSSSSSSSTDVNWAKMMKLGCAFIEIVRSQEVPYASLPYSHELLQWIHSSPAVDSADADDISDPISPSSSSSTILLSGSDDDFGHHGHGSSPSSTISIGVSPSNSFALSDSGRMSSGGSPSSPSDQDASRRIAQLLRRRETRKQAEMTKENLVRETKQAKSAVKKKLTNTAAVLQQIAPYLDADELEQASSSSLVGLAPSTSIEEMAVAVRSIVGFNEALIEDEVLCSLEDWQSNTERAAALGKSLSESESSVVALLADRDKSVGIQEDVETQVATYLRELSEQVDGWTSSPDCSQFEIIGALTKQMIDLLSSTAHLEK